MKSILRSGIPLFTGIFFFMMACTNRPEKGAMIATCASDKAVETYKQAYQVAYHVLNLDDAVSLYKQATMEDPDFFMAYYQLATFYLFHGDREGFTTNANAAIGCDIALSKGEEIQKQILKAYLDKKNEDARKLGSRLVKLYPDDPDSYFNLGYIDFLDKDYPGAIKAFEKSMTMKDTGTLYCGPKLAIVPICMLGYACLLSDQMEKANESFDKYVELFPGDQNPYDCKADYYIATGNYEKAYESYMTAYQIDTTYKIFLQRAIDVKDREKNGGSE